MVGLTSIVFCKLTFTSRTNDTTGTTLSPHFFFFYPHFSHRGKRKKNRKEKNERRKRVEKFVYNYCCLNYLKHDIPCTD